MTISDVIYLVLACYGLAAIAQHWGEVFTVIRVLGAAYLIYLGLQLWRAPVHPRFDDSPARARHSASFLQGFLISASNPKVILFYLAFLPTFMDLTTLTGLDIALAATLTLTALMLGLMLIALTAARARRYFRSPQAMRGLNRTSGSIMIGAGVYLAMR
jgi:threonine/homoserine/homoserine lactone efflux protein